MRRQTWKENKPLEYYLNLRYPVLLVPEPEGGFTALVPDLEGCVSVGETEEEALANLEEARQLWIETAYEHGDEIPLPSSAKEYSGRILVRMPKSLHRRLDEEARAEGISLNQLIVSLLSERLSLAVLKRELRALKEGAPPKSSTKVQT
ncbi:MAG: type II toxin-antitoxin system HicB family antitoxin [Thermus sp.]|uniref:type II toxin-antitoxin system HicB family antitoxin n=1 Tax=Thermus sp. TaxID=275 RepID=UPI0025D2F27E|nr:type II toxin-antitoxin system HicB family antitoxin [Thermus sp.]MCS7219261.1 type II toxin-antitoxin system HicB family antitoxin [Thermus sp.]